MSEELWQKTPLLTGFAGENLVGSDLLKFPQLSPDARNNDYLDGTIKKRAGFKRLDDRPFRGGGVILTQSLGAQITYTGTGWDNTAAGAWAVQFCVKFRWLNPDADPEFMYILGNRANTDGTGAGWDYSIKRSGSNYYHAARFYTTPGGSDIEVVSSVDVGDLTTADAYDEDQIYTITIEYRGDVSPREYNIYFDGVKTSVTDASEQFFPNGTTTLELGYQGAVPSFEYIANLSDLRLWTIAGLTGTDYTDHVTLRETTTYRRSLYSDEQATSELDLYWPFLGATPLTDALQSNAMAVTKPATSTDEEIFGPGLALITDFSQDHIRKIDFLGDRGGGTFDFLVQTDYAFFWWVYDPDNFAAANTKKRLIQYMRNAVSLGPVSTTPFRNKIIIAKDEVENWKCQYHSSQWNVHKLTPRRPDATLVITADGAAGNPNGAYNYRFLFYNSNDGVYSLYSEAKAHTTAGANKIEISGLPGSDRDDGQCDYIDIYRTKAGGAVYYKVARIAITEVTYSDNVADGSLTEILNDYVGIGDPARAVAEHDGRVFLLYPDGLVLWSEVTTLDLVGNFAAHYFENFIYVALNYGDELVGGFSEGGRLVLGCRNSVWQLTGYGPSTYRVDPLFRGGGMVNPNCWASSHKASYMLTPYGVLGLPFGGAAEIMSAPFRTLFENIDGSSWRTACMAFYSVTQELWVTFDTVNSGRVTVVYNEARNSWARFDIDISAYCVFDPKDGAPKLLAGWRGYVVELRSETNDGAGDDGGNTGTLTGTVTSGAAGSMTDSGASFLNGSQMSPAVYQHPVGGLSGCKLEVIDSNGSIQERIIGHNDGTTVYPTVDFTSTPQAGWTYRISGIKWWYSTAPMPPSGDFALSGAVNRGNFYFKNPEDVDVTLTPTYDETAGSEITLDPEEINCERLIDLRAKKFQMKFHNYAPGEPVEIEAFQIELQQRQERT